MPQVEGDDRILVDRLDAVLILYSADNIKVDPSIDDLEGVLVDFDAHDSLVYRVGIQQIAQRYIGRPISLRNVNQLARDIILRYRECKQPIVDVQILEQQITGGTIQQVIIETRIDRVKVESGCYFRCNEIQRWIECTRHGDRVYEQKLENDLLWANNNPFRYVGVDFEKGRTRGTTDVLFTVSDVRPLRGCIGADDTGVISLRYGRVFAGFSYGNLFGRGRILGYQYTTDQDFAKLRAHAVSYSQPLNRKYSATTSGS